ncbi:protein kintoun [Leptopilina heterotoma]|uniref:protein kintoun n=1 Tax=Leptopilina heterotoma TaxID=63436 RepID=UPI001CAA0888|nr:protein kintoun [Leptopilina heterotoma]
MDAYEKRAKDWEDLEVTKSELKDLTECLKKEEFRKMLIEYAEEVNDPENKKLYQKEITELEKQRGVDVTFVNPEPGYVIKTSVNDERKCFLNISQSKIVNKPSSQPSENDGNRGLQWSIPYTLAPPRDDLDKKNTRCTVYDVVFHPDTLYLASKNLRFKELVNNSAIDGVENNFKVKLDRKNLKFPKMNFKGTSEATVIRKECEKPVEQLPEAESEIYQKIISGYDNYREKQSQKLEDKPQRSTPKTIYYKNMEKSQDLKTEYTIPKYTITHQSDLELEEFTYTKDAKMYSATPKRLIVVIHLPLLKSANDARLDIHERSLTLRSEKPAKYLLELPLSYSVDGDNGNAKFDTKCKKLTVTLPVIRKSFSLTDPREDSGVDTDHGSPVRDANDEFENAEGNCSKSNSRPLIVELNKESEVQINEFDDTALRTRESVDITPFMNPNIKYNIPMFTCNTYDNILAITIHVKNVDSESICHKVLDNMLGIHVLLTSVGAGFFPVYYSICFKLDNNAVDPTSITIEPWDNNVIITLALKSTDLSRYFVGLNEEIMEAKDFSSAISVKSKLKELVEEPEEETDKNIEVIRNGEEVVVSIHSNSIDTDEEDRETDQSSSCHEERKRNLELTRSISESSGDELPSSNGSTYRSKGILKSHRNHISRSVSESSIDESACLASSINFQYDSVQELNSESESSSLKKTVRFSDVVSRQLYRSNSSILGQRKKNQRKLRNKKRAHDRRMSESENSETEERDKYKVELKSELQSNQMDSVRPILSKNGENHKTDNIEIEVSRNNINTNALHKRKTNKKRNEILVNDDKETESGDEIHVELKNDLIFDLDM